jgi:hypothetical protein
LSIAVLIAAAAFSAVFKPVDKPSEKSFLKTRAIPEKPAGVTISEGADIPRVVVKFKEGAIVQLSNNEFVSAADKSGLSQ